MEEYVELVVISKDSEGENLQLIDVNGKIITSFWVEYENDTCIISYETSPQYRKKGYASYGLNLVKQKLFFEENKLFLELIHLSGDYSRKVAENAGFFQIGYTLNCFRTVNPNAIFILDERRKNGMNEEKYNKLVEKVNKLNKISEKYFQDLRDKLNSLNNLALSDNIDSEYKTQIEDEIKHLEHVFNIDEKIETKKI